MKNFFVSSTVSGSKDILNSLDYLYKNGISNIELTGGLDRIPDLEMRLSDSINSYEGLNLRCHNYFPPPEKGFVLNLCGNEKVVEASLNLITEAVSITSLLQAQVYGIHAGFRVQPGVNELGQPFSLHSVVPLVEAEELFCFNLKRAKKISLDKKIELFIENNVFSTPNKKVFGNDNPFLLCCYADYERLSKLENFNFLLDVAHLKVSCNSLGLSFEKEFNQLVQVAEYIHLSDNSGLTDDNFPLEENSELFDLLKSNKQHLRDKHVTFEIYNSVEDVKKSMKIFESIF